MVPAIMDHFGFDKASVLGHHTGAIIVTEAALQAPERIDKIVLNGPLPLTDEERAYFLGMVEAEKSWAPRWDGSHLTEIWETRRAAQADWSDLDAFHTHVIHGQLAGSHVWYAHAAVMAYKHEEALPRITHPSLILANTGDAIYAQSQRAKEMRPDFAYTELEGGTIDIIDEQPDAWVQAVAEFPEDMKAKIHLIAAARPNFMKVAPLYHALEAEHEAFDVSLVHTGQHYDANMSDSFFADLGMPDPHFHLGVGSGTHAEQTGRTMIEYEKVCVAEKPDWVVVVGDVNATVAVVLVCTKLHVPVVHLEAGLRSRDRTMPEEINRLVTDSIADLLWTPSPDGDENLLAEGVPAERIERVGNIMIDSFEMMRERIEAAGTRKRFGLEDQRYGVVTMHRPANVDDLAEYQEHAEPLLHERFETADEASPEKLRVALALLESGRETTGYINGELAELRPVELLVVCQRLHPEAVDTESLWFVLEDDQERDSRRLRSAMALAATHPPEDDRWQSVLPSVAEWTVEHLSRNPRDIDLVLQIFDSLRHELLPRFAHIAGDVAHSRSQQEWAFSMLLEYADGNPAVLTENVMNAQPWQFDRVLARLLPDRATARAQLEAVLDLPLPPEGTEAEKEQHAIRQANAAVALLKLAYADAVWPVLQHRPDPRTATYVIHQAPQFDVDPRVFVERLPDEPDVTVQRAILLALGGYSQEDLPQKLQEDCAVLAREFYATHPDAGLHSASEWLLRKWGHDDALVSLRQAAVNDDSPASPAQWFLTSRGHTMLVVRGATFPMGSPSLIRIRTKTKPGTCGASPAYLRSWPRR